MIARTGQPDKTVRIVHPGQETENNIEETENNIVVTEQQAQDS